MNERKSTPKNKVLKSYGFRSHEGTPLAAGEDPKARHKSRGKRNAVPSDSGRTQELASKPDIAPFKLDRDT